MGIEKVLNINEVAKYCGIAKSTINRLRAIDDFPVPIMLSERRIGFLFKELEQWISARQRKKRVEVSTPKRKIRCPQTPLELQNIIKAERTEMKARREGNL